MIYCDNHNMILKYLKCKDIQGKNTRLNLVKFNSIQVKRNFFDTMSMIVGQKMNLPCKITCKLSLLKYTSLEISCNRQAADIYLNSNGYELSIGKSADNKNGSTLHRQQV